MQNSTTYLYKAKFERPFKKKKNKILSSNIKMELFSIIFNHYNAYIGKHL